jgi:alpha-L-fucosidase
MKTVVSILFISIVLSVAGSQSVKDNDSKKWTNPLIKMRRLSSPLVEVEPFVLNGEFYLLECWRSNWDWPGQPSKEAGSNSEIWVAKLPNGPKGYSDREYISCAMKGNEFGTAIVWENRVYVFAVNEASNRQFVEMTWSEDLINWSKPVKVFDSPVGNIYNVSLTRDDDGFVFQWETNKVGTYFTMCFGHLDKLTDNWNDNIIENAKYGEDKYTGGPKVLDADGWYYLLYLERLGSLGWETRVTRSKDLVNWQDAPEDRAFLPFNKNYKNLPLHSPEIPEKNASDPGVACYNGQVIVYFTGGIQKKAGDLQWAKFNGTLKELMEYFF